MIHEISDRLTDKLTDLEGKASTYLSPYQYLTLRKHPEIYKQIDFFFFDGFLLAKILSLLKLKKYNVLPPDMSGFLPELFNKITHERGSVFLLGSTSDSIERSKNILNESFPDLVISGYRDGYFNDAGDIINQILDIEPTLVLVGMGVPRQENFLVKLKDAGFKNTALTCGGFFHQTAQGSTDYYPSFVKKLNMRWVFRMFDEPHLIKRYFILYPFSILLLIFDLLIQRLKKK